MVTCCFYGTRGSGIDVVLRANISLLPYLSLVWSLSITEALTLILIPIAVSRGQMTEVFILDLVYLFAYPLGTKTNFTLILIP